ncbi:FAD binding domain-containing protein [Arthrobacter sp. NPDC058130]|uniref:FAD binding domain-containing protein n=1 Tax=Arthrobacter sp. NPDC058130 TaxID=3346353 RepID=UPI0036EC5004
MQVLRPTSVPETLAMLEASDDDAKIISGGTALMLMLRNGLVFPTGFIALDRVEGLDYIQADDTEIRIGALTTLRTVERSAELQTLLPTLTQALGMVANHRVRNRATIAGNVCEADYASDPPAILTTLGCQVRVAGPQGERLIALTDLLVDYYETSLEHNELAVEVIIPRPDASTRTNYLKYVSRSSEDRPCVGVAASVSTDDAGRFRSVDVQIAGATATPFSIRSVLEECEGAEPGDETWDHIARSYAEGIDPIDDARGSSSYRRRVTRVLIERALREMNDDYVNGATKL